MDDYARGGARGGGGGYRSDRSPKRFRQDDDHHLCGLATPRATLFSPSDLVWLHVRSQPRDTSLTAGNYSHFPRIDVTWLAASDAGITADACHSPQSIDDHGSHKARQPW